MAEWAAQLKEFRGLDSSAIADADRQLQALESATRLNGKLKTYRSCEPGSPPTCSNPSSDFRAHGEIYIGIDYVRASGDGTENLDLKIPQRDTQSKRVKAERQASMTYTMIGARQAGEFEILLYNDDGDLIGTTTVTVSN